MLNSGKLYKMGLGRASRSARTAAKYSEELAGTLSNISERYKHLAEQQTEGDWRVGSMQHHQKLEKLMGEVRQLRQKAREVLRTIPSR